MHLEVDLRRQWLGAWDQGRLLREYTISTAANGAGEIQGSGATPRGRHIIRVKIGAGAVPGTVFRGRRPTGEVWSPTLHAQAPQRDWILTRILWLSGLERGVNRLGCVDSFRRYIYLHGTPPTAMLGHPASKGCVRMNNDDIVDLFDLVPVGTEVHLHE